MIKYDSNIIAACCAAIIAIGTGIYFNEMSVFLRTGYYFIFISFSLWLFSILRLIPVNAKSDGILVSLTINHWPAIVCSLVIMLFAVSISHPEIKILYDETNLIATSKTMYREHEFHMWMVSVVRDFGEAENVVFSVDKRGLFFPFLLSVCHTFLGYDAHNGFIVNLIAGYFLLLAFYFLLDRWFQKETAMLGMIMLSTFPIIIIYTLSSGFEVLNALFVVISFYLLDMFLTKKDWRYAEALLLNLVLLSQIRYESAVFALAMMLTLAITLQNAPRYKFTFLTYITPFLFLPVLWQRLLTSDYQLPAAYTQIFSLDYVFVHFPQWISFFSGKEQSYGMIGIIFYMSIAGLIFAVFKYFTAHKNISFRKKTMAATAIGSFSIVALIIMSFWSGSLVEPFVSRLSIVFIPFIIFFALVFIEILIESKQPAKIYFPLIGLILIILYWPEVEKNKAVRSIDAYRRYHLVTEYINTNFSDKTIAVIDPHVTSYNIHEWGSISYVVANKNTESLLGRLADNSLDELIVVQNISFPEGEIYDLYKLNDQYKLKELHVRRIRDDTSVKISKVYIN